MASPFRLFLFVLCMALLAGCQKEVSGDAANVRLHLNFTNEAGGVPLETGINYTNTLGETFSVSKFKYYITNLALLNGSKVTELPETYFLVDQDIDSTKTISVDLAPGSYTGLRFLVGVDSTRNVSGAQSGALDPVLDMFWTWNTGYIMAKLEGTSPLSTAPNNRIQYHIGGFSGATSSLRTLQFNFPTPVLVNKEVQVNITAELLRWFDGVHSLPISQQAVSMTPGALASKYADNYANMFRLNSVLIP